MACGLPRADKRFGGFVRATSVQMLFKFIAPLGYDADSRQRSGVAERAEGAPQHVFREVAHEVDVFRPAVTRVEAVEHFTQPRGAFTARDAPTAGLVRIE